MENLEKALKQTPDGKSEWMTKLYPISMPAAAWRLLTMYHVVLTHKQTKIGSPRFNLARLIGGIVAWYVFQRAGWIREQFMSVEAEQLHGHPLAGSYSPEKLATIRSAPASELVDAVKLDGGYHPQKE